MTSHIPQANIMLEEDTILVLTQYLEPGSERADAYLGRYSRDTLEHNDLPWIQKEWYRPLLTNLDQDIRAVAMAPTVDGNIIVIGTLRTFGTDGEVTQNVFLLKTTEDAQLIWSTELPFPGEEEAVQVVPAPDGGFWLLQNTPTEPWLLKTEALGNLEWEMALDQHPGDQAADMMLAANGDLVLTGKTAADALYVLRLDTEGTPLWRQTYAGTAYATTAGNGLIEDLDGHILVAGESTLATTGEQAGLLAKLRSDGTPLWERTYGKEEVTDAFNTITRTPSGQHLMAGYRQLDPGSPSTMAYFVKTDTLGLVKGGQVRGNVFHDLDEDCTLTMGDNPLEGWLVRATNDSLSFSVKPTKLAITRSRYLLPTKNQWITWYQSCPRLTTGKFARMMYRLP